MNGPLQSYGNTSHILIQGRDCYCASDAERKWLIHIEPMLAAGEIKEWKWQPKPGYQITYNHGGQVCSYIYEPDAVITWASGAREVIEIKRGALHQRAGTKMKRFCQQYDECLVLVWFGNLPKKGKIKRRLDTLTPWLHHIWLMK